MYSISKQVLFPEFLFTNHQPQHLDGQQGKGRLHLTAHNLPLPHPIPSMPE